jgi:hypothetical protein
MTKYKVGDIVKASRTFRTLIDYDSDNHYGVVSQVCMNKYGKTTIEVEWFDGMHQSCYEREINLLERGSKGNG